MSGLLDTINGYINMIGIRNIIIVAVVLVIVVIAVMIYRSLRLNVLRKRIVELENQMNATKSLPLQYRLGRVKSIAKNMEEVQPLYDKYEKEFNSITDFQKNDIEVLLNDVDEKLFYRKLRKVNSSMLKLETMLEEYDERSNNLLKEMEKVTEIENIQRLEIIRVKEKYRVQTDYYETIRYKIEEFIPHVNDIFKSVDDDFIHLEDLMNHQKFEEAKLATEQIEKKIDWIGDNFKNLPDYVTVVRSYVPEKINEIQKLIDSMPENQYAMHRLAITDRFEGIKIDLNNATRDIKSLQLNNCPKELDSLTANIDGLIEDIQNEKKSFDKFNEEWDECYNNLENVYNQYKQAIADYNKMKELYDLSNVEIDIDEKFEEFNEYLKHSYDLEELMKTGQFAYSLMIKDVEELNENILKHQPYLNDFFSVRDELYLQEQRAIDELENINIVLLEIKSEIKNKHLPMINESYKDYIQESYDKAAAIQAYRENRPVNLRELSKKVDEARDVIYKLYDNVHNLVVTAQMVEEAIVFGNRYRSNFLEVNTELTKAEVLFRNGEYTKALTTAVDIIEKIKPGSYEELIKKTSKQPA